ncbi:unnamed protein product, partial [marine sediment metagenome]
QKKLLSLYHLNFLIGELIEKLASLKGHMTLDHEIGVRIPASQPALSI